MSPTPRLTIAFVLTLAVGAVPLVADWCAASCEAAIGGAGSSAAEPSCHHARRTAARIGHHPSSCGQSHNPIVVDATATAARTSRIAVEFPRAVLDSEPARRREPPAMMVRAGPDVGRAPALLALQLASPLRI
jgi:hypothetical protein